MINSAEQNDTLKNDALRMRRSITWAAVVIAALWIIRIFEDLQGISLSGLGVFPLKATGLLGIFFAPLIHGSWLHLAANTGPVFILLTALLYSYPRSTKIVLPVVYFGTGVIVWLCGREVYHIGASGVTFGMLFFITTMGFMRRDKKAIALALAVFFLYGGMMGGLFPEDKTISYETHIAAACLGIILAIVLRKLDPPPPPKVYSWELDDDEDDDWWMETELDEDERESETKEHRLH